jgi:hypothetical protein
MIFMLFNNKNGFPNTSEYYRSLFFSKITKRNFVPPEFTGLQLTHSMELGPEKPIIA